MNWLIVEDGIITNIIVADEDVAERLGALPYYDDCGIGMEYDPPKEPEPEYVTYADLAAAIREGVNGVD